MKLRPEIKRKRSCRDWDLLPVVIVSDSLFQLDHFNVFGNVKSDYGLIWLILTHLIETHTVLFEFD